MPRVSYSTTPGAASVSRAELPAAAGRRAIEPAINAQLLRDALWVLATRLTNRGSNFLTFLLVARSLPVDAFGLYGYVVATTLVLSVACDMGLRQAAAQRMGADPGAASAVTTHLLL